MDLRKKRNLPEFRLAPPRKPPFFPITQRRQHYSGTAALLFQRLTNLIPVHQRYSVCIRIDVPDLVFLDMKRVGATCYLHLQRIGFLCSRPADWLKISIVVRSEPVCISPLFLPDYCTVRRNRDRSGTGVLIGLQINRNLL